MEMESIEDKESIDESPDDADVEEESNVSAKEVAALKEPVEKVGLVELVTTTVPPTTVITTTEMMAETVKTRDSDMETTTGAEDETTTVMSSEMQEKTEDVQPQDEAE